MRSLQIVAISIALAVAGCSQPAFAPQAPPSFAGALRQGVTTAAPALAVLHAFDPAKGDGSSPTSGLIDVKGTLYGTTSYGGTHPGLSGEGDGTIFSMKADGSGYRVLHNFGSTKTDGFGPSGELVLINGLLYGATGGGKYDSGTIYSINPTTGQLHTLYNFGAKANDGAGPLGVVYLHGMLYGVTSYGGKYDTGPPYHTTFGTVFSLTLSGSEKILHNFHGSGYADAATPAGNLVELNGTLYGTSQYGGTSNKGTVFSVTAAGNERVLHNFSDAPDAAEPLAGLIAYAGKLYGTTGGGGANGLGSVFDITPAGQEHVIFSFTNANGAVPRAPLFAENGVLYGSASSGGKHGYGVAFSLTTAGRQTVLYNFAYAPAPCLPESRLLGIGGALYGTTAYGGAYYQYPRAGGTVFRLAP